MTTVVK